MCDVVLDVWIYRGFTARVAWTFKVADCDLRAMGFEVSV